MKKEHLRPSWALPNDSKRNVASFSTISTDLLSSQMPRSVCKDKERFTNT